MRLRIHIILSLAIMAAVIAGCSAGQGGRGAAPTPVPTKTLRPTFTSAPAKAATVAPVSGQPTTAPLAPAQPVASPTPRPPSPTPVPPTLAPPTATPTPEKATFTVTDPTVNVRAGPGANFPLLGEVRQGQKFDITGKNPAGDWWQFTFDGRPAWITGQFVSVNAASQAVQVASNIPAPPPTSRPQPTSPPPPPQPTQPPAPSYSFSAGRRGASAEYERPGDGVVPRDDTRWQGAGRWNPPRDPGRQPGQARPTVRRHP